MKKLAILGLLAPLVLAGCGGMFPQTSASSSATANGGVIPVPPESADPNVWLNAVDIHGGTHQVDCIKVLRTDQYSQGLSGGPASHGALFVFKPPSVQSFWMKNTPTRLVIYWLDAKDHILGQDDMVPDSTTLYTPPAPIAAAIELPANLVPDYGVSGLTTGAQCKQSA